MEFDATNNLSHTPSQRLFQLLYRGFYLKEKEKEKKASLYNSEISIGSSPPLLYPNKTKQKAWNFCFPFPAQLPEELVPLPVRLLLTMAALRRLAGSQRLLGLPIRAVSSGQTTNPTVSTRIPPARPLDVVEWHPEETKEEKNLFAKVRTVKRELRGQWIIGASWVGVLFHFCWKGRAVYLERCFIFSNNLDR